MSLKGFVYFLALLAILFRGFGSDFGGGYYGKHFVKYFYILFDS